MKSPNVPQATTATLISWLQNLAGPNLDIKDVGDRRKAQLTLILAIVLTLTNITSLFFVGRNGILNTFYIQIILTIVTFLAYLLGRSRRFIWGSVTLIASLSLSGLANVIAGSDQPGDALYVTIPIAFIIGSALLPVWGNVIQFIGSLIAISILPVVTPNYTFSDVGANMSVIFTAGLLLLVVQLFRDGIERARLAEVQKVNQELRELGTTLEQRVSDRTKALRTSAEVSRRLAAVNNPRQLAVDVVEEVQSAFNYYHAHIYFVDEASGDLLMAGGTGEAGAAMLARGHRIPKGRGLVGRAADTNAPVLVPDVTKEEGWLPNPMLPETKSETAIPISLGKQVLGVLDVQQNVVNGLGEEDVELLQSLASQVAISLQNARTLDETRTKASLETLANAIGQKIQRAASVEETLQTAIREIGNALGATRVKASIARHQDGDDNVI